MELKRIRTRLLTLLFVCIAIYSFGQQGQSFKLYQNTDIFQLQCIRLHPREETKQGNANFSRISLAVVFTSRKRSFHEVELLIPEFSKPIEKLDFPLEYTFWKGELFDSAGNSYSFRYEFGKLLGDKSKPINFLLSAGINPYYVQLEYTPDRSNDYYRSTTYYGFALNATPRLYFKLNRHFSIDLNIPIRIYNFQKAKYQIDNPILPAQQQRFTDTNHLFLEPVYTIRLGLMWHLSSGN
jgi:hypothetical protein